MTSTFLHAASAAICLSWALLVLVVGRGRGALLLAATATAAGAWAAAVALSPAAPMDGAAALFEIGRSAVWFLALLLMWRHVAGVGSWGLLRGLGGIGVILTLFALASLLPQLGLPSVLARLGLALLVVTMAENLFRAAPEAARWHVVLPCIALGGLAAFDVALYAQAALTGGFSMAMIDARAVLTAMAAPLLAIAAVRGRRLRRDPPISREMVFHGATLVVAGTFLLAVGAAGEALRQFGDGWARTAQLVLVASALAALALLGSSRSARSWLKRLVVDHFFRMRYDYRREWLRCAATLAESEAGDPADLRAIRAIADPVDSPAGLLLLGSPGDPVLRWAGAWNAASEIAPVPPDHALVAALRGGSWVAEVAPGDFADARAALPDLWLVVPLLHPRDGLLGAVLLARPRAGVDQDGEMFDLLRTLGREVAMFLAERRSAQAVADQARLQAYAGRFAFVAHDVKTVASQLTMLLGNAEANIGDPEFQQDMLMTVRASADRINALIARLRVPDEAAPAPAALDPLARLRVLVARRPAPIELQDDDGTGCRIVIGAEQFDAAITHLLDNATEASPPEHPVRIRLGHADRKVVVDITDRGPGMSEDFVRDALFRPLVTSKPLGNGIGAWQARALLRQAGGDLAVLTRKGEGTTMRLILPCAGACGHQGASA